MAQQVLYHERQAQTCLGVVRKYGDQQRVHLSLAAHSK